MTWCVEVGDSVWVRTHYRWITEVCEIMEDGRLRVYAHDERDDGVYQMAITKHEPEVRAAPVRTRSARERLVRPRVTPELRQRVQDGLSCKYGHDLTANLPNGKPGLTFSKDGKQVCRWCKQEAADRWKLRQQNGVQPAADEVESST